MQEMLETWVQSLGWEDSLEEEMATHSSMLCLENSMDRGVWWTTVMGSQDLGIIVQIGSFMEQALLCSRHHTKG